MKNNALITIKSRQITDDDDYKIELMCEGTYDYTEGKTVVKYEESKDSGMENTKTTLVIEGKKVVMTREGGNNSRMEFTKGVKYKGHYDTPYGAFTIGVLSDEVSVNIDENGGDINIDYLMEMNIIPASRNKINLSIKRIETN